MGRICGIYCIKNIFRNKMYIGKSININDRYRQHFMKLRNNSHHSHKLQASWNKYPDEYFVYGIIEECPVEVLDEREKYYIDLYDTYNNGFNEQIPNGKNSGHLFTAADRAKHSIAIRKSRQKWTAEDWSRNKEYLDRGRATAMLHDRRLPILLYDGNTLELKHRFNNIEECAKFLGSSINSIEKAIYRIRHGKRFHYKNFILICDNGSFSINNYVESKLKHCNNILLKNEIRTGLAIINKFSREYNNKLRVRNNYDNKCKSWKENSKKSVESLRKSRKHAVDIYLFDTGEYIGRWGLISDFAKEYNLNVKYLRRVTSGDQNHHKNYVVKRVN